MSLKLMGALYVRGLKALASHEQNSAIMVPKATSASPILFSMICIVNLQQCFVLLKIFQNWKHPTVLHLNKTLGFRGKNFAICFGLN